MSNWFTVEQIDEGTFAVSEYRHWEEPHCYLLCGTESAVLVDTGLGVSNLQEVVGALTKLPVTVVTTHAHWDHIGGHRYFSKIAVHEAETEWLAGRFPLSLEAVRKNLTRQPCAFPEGFAVDNYQVFQGAPQITLHDGDCLDLGNRRLSVIHTPGHSPGHCCFYDPEQAYLFSGDLLYSGCLDAFYPSTDPGLFYQSVKKIRARPIRRVLPGHHRLALPADFAARVETAFGTLEQAGKLEQGAGIFDFGDFQIHI